MSKLSLSVYLNAYNDINPSNNPNLNNFKWYRDLNSIFVNNPTNQYVTVAPGETYSFFSGTRTLLQDNTTQYSIAPTSLMSNSYTLSWVGGTAPNFRTPRTTGADATTAVNVTLNGPIVTFSAPTVIATYATFTGQVAGMTSSITLTANTIGTVGNSIVLTGDGTSSIATLISNWNTANPSNQVTLTAGIGTQIPSIGATIPLSGGVNSGTAFNLTSVQVGDFVTIGSNFNPLNQGTFQIIALTSTSFTIENEIGVTEGPIILGSGYATQVQIFSAAGVQINDTIVISGGFSKATWGSYLINAVFANSLQFTYLGALPSESNILTESITIYSSAKQLVYMESDTSLDILINDIDIGQVKPFVINNASMPQLPPQIIPGMFMLKSTIWTLSVTNNSLNSANVYFAAVE